MVNVQSSCVRLTKNSLWRAKHYGALVLLKGRFRTSSGVHRGTNRRRKVFSSHGIHGWRVNRGEGSESARASVPREEQLARRAAAVSAINLRHRSPWSPNSSRMDAREDSLRRREGVGKPWTATPRRGR